MSDNGCGIPEANLSRIFDPFFTTKPVGRAPASASPGLRHRRQAPRPHRSREHGEVGTTFRVQLPVRQPESEKPSPDKHRPAGSRTPRCLAALRRATETGWAGVTAGAGPWR